MQTNKTGKGINETQFKSCRLAVRVNLGVIFWNFEASPVRCSVGAFPSESDLYI